MGGNDLGIIFPNLFSIYFAQSKFAMRSTPFPSSRLSRDGVVQLVAFKFAQITAHSSSEKSARDWLTLPGLPIGPAFRRSFKCSDFFISGAVHLSASRRSLPLWSRWAPSGRAGARNGGIPVNADPGGSLSRTDDFSRDFRAKRRSTTPATAGNKGVSLQIPWAIWTAMAVSGRTGLCLPLPSPLAPRSAFPVPCSAAFSPFRREQFHL